MIKVGLTGGYGSGKSTVARMFSELGAPTIDADSIVCRMLSEDKGIIDRITGLFGERVLAEDGTIDRRRVADIVFDDNDSLASLTEALYPAVRMAIAEWFGERGSERVHRVAVAEISMLIEGGALEFYDETVVVAVSPEVQRRRCLEKGIASEEFERRTGNQMPLAEKVRLADYAIDNNGTLAETRIQVLRVWSELITRRVRN